MRKNYTKEDIINEVNDKDIEFIRLQFTDILGNLKNVAITSSQLDKVLNNACKFDCSSIEGFAGSEEAELFLHPDLSTLEIFPWRPQQGRVARLICDVYEANGEPFEGDCRYILKKVIEEAKEMGYVLEVGPECEFFLFHTDEDGMPTTITHEQAGYFDLGPIDLGENARRDMVLNLEEMGFEVEASHHENAPAQHEIDFKYDEALATADNIITFKLAVKTIAKRHGLHATFMPKPKEAESGSGMHLTMSLFKDGKNIFSSKSDSLGLSEEAYYFIGGIMNHAKALTLITNPLINSYKRLNSGYEAPTYITWSEKYRDSLVLIPSARGEETKVELRSPDPATNPYLAIAVCLKAGLDGIRNKTMPPKNLDCNVLEKTEETRKLEKIEKLPENLYEAIQEFKKDEVISGVLGEYVSNIYISKKEQEWNAYKKQVTKWEIDQYLYKY